MRGRMGTGKGVFANAVGSLLGRHYIQIAQASQVTGRFNTHLKDAVLVFVDEGFWAGDRQAEGVIKNMVTEPFINIEPKGKDIIRVRNNVNLIIASNNNWVVPAGLEERRFYVMDIPDTHQQDHEYFRAIANELNNGGREAMLYDLLNMDISGVDLRKIERTEGLFDQILASMTTIQKWWFERLRQGALIESHHDWFGIVSVDDQYQSYITFSETMKDRYPKSPEQLGRELNNMCEGINRKRPRTTDSYGKSKREYVREFPDLDECRKQFEQLIKMGIDWDNDHEDPIPF